MGIAVSQRPLRADARRNRERILSAAREAFAAGGAEAQMDDVAARAGVGVGTVYRHFPTKDALLAALVRERFDRFAVITRERLEHPDPWEAFAGALRGTHADAREDRAMQDALLAADPEMCLQAAVASGTWAAMDELIGRAHAAGVLRPGFRVEHIPMVMGALCASLTVPVCDAEPHLEILLDGLRRVA